MGAPALPQRGCICQPRVAPRYEALPWVPVYEIIPQRGFILLVLPGRSESDAIPLGQPINSLDPG